MAIEVFDLEGDDSAGVQFRAPGQRELRLSALGGDGAQRKDAPGKTTLYLTECGLAP